jgi:hypothetical protein
MKAIIAIICFLLFNLGFSQEPNSEYKYIFELSKSQQTSFKIIEKKWFDKVFIPYNSKMKVKISDCRKCGDLYVDLGGKIDQNGKFITDTKYGKKCGIEMNPKLYKYFTIYFDEIVFPENLRNLKIQHRFGVVYKC